MGSQPLSQAPSVSTRANDSHTGDILVASTAIAGLAVAVLVVFPAVPTLAGFKLVDFTLFEEAGHISITCGFALMLCGFCALLSALGTIGRLMKEEGISLLPLRVGRPSSLILLLISLICFLVVFLGVNINYMQGR